MPHTIRTIAATLIAGASVLTAATTASAQVIDDRPEAQADIGARALLIRDGSTFYARLYADNVGRQDMSGSLAVKYRGKSLGRQKVDVDSGYNSSGNDVRIPAKLIKRIDRDQRLPLTVTGTLTGDKGATQRVNSRVTLLIGGPTSAYDGTYRGTGGLTIVVMAGTINSINVGVNLFCPQSGSSMTRQLGTLDGFPAIVDRAGRFKATGSDSPDTVRYEGTLKRRGTSKGYLSLFHTSVSQTDGSLGAEQCYGASNWTATRSKR